VLKYLPVQTPENPISISLILRSTFISLPFWIHRLTLIKQNAIICSKSFLTLAAKMSYPFSSPKQCKLTVHRQRGVSIPRGVSLLVPIFLLVPVSVPVPVLVPEFLPTWQVRISEQLKTTKDPCLQVLGLPIPHSSQLDVNRKSMQPSSLPPR